MLTDNIIGSVEGAFRLFLDNAGNNIDQSIEIDTALNEKVFVSKDGALATFVRVDGNIIEDNNFTSMKHRTDMLNNKIFGYFEGSAHQFHICFRNEAKGQEAIVEAAQSKARDGARTLGLDMDGLFSSQATTLASRITSENVYFVLWTTIAALDTSEFAKEKSDSQEDKGNLSSSDKTQSLTTKYERLTRKHSEYVKDVCGAISQLGCKLSVIKRNDALNILGRAFQPFSEGGLDYIFPDDEYFARSSADSTIRRADSADLLWPSISEQVIKQDVLDVSGESDILGVDDYDFTTFEVKMPPRGLVTFNDLIEGMDNQNVPYQISFNIISDVGFSYFWKKILSNIPFPKTNGRLRNSIAAVDAMTLIGESSVEYKVSISTWARDRTTLLDNKEHLKRKVTSWGSSQVRNYKGSPLLAFVRSTPGLSKRTFGATSYAPLLGVLPQLPLSRRASIWDKSALSFVTEDGKLFPFAATSNSLQKAWNIGVVGTMGSGKSVLVQCIALSHILNHVAQGEMPFVGYLDIGFSSKNVVEMCRAVAPPSMKSKFLHKTLQNNKNHAYNIHDTQLGCRYPDMDQNKFISNFYLTLLTPAGRDTPNPELEGIIKQAVADAYKYRSDDGKPKEYSKGKDIILDGILESYGITSTVTYWDLVDLLFDDKNISGALRCQRYAVPTIDDIISQLSGVSNSIKANYANVTVGDGSPELLVGYTIRQLTQAIEQYPVISHPTQLDVEDSRFTVLDLNDVAKDGGGASGKKETSIFYTLGRFIVTRNFFITSDILNYAPDKYKRYHEERVRKIKGIPKLMVYDEFHRVGGVKSLESMLLMEMREGRKWNLSILMASQLLKDFSSSFTSLMGSFFMLSNDAGTPEEAKARFPFNKHLFDYFQMNCNGPDGANGTPFVAEFKLKKHVVRQSLRFVLSPFYYWMTTSDSVDNDLIGLLSHKLDRGRILEILVDKYPMGVRRVIETISADHPDVAVRSDPLGFVCDGLMSA